MSDKENLTLRPPLSPFAAGCRLAIIGGILVLFAIAFAYAGGWLTPERLTPARMVAALSDRGGNPLGHRRNHSKGMCFTGEFEANGAGSQYSGATMLAAGRYPVVGRFAIAVGNPAASDVMGRVKSMAIRIVTPNGQEWRSGMNNSPVFVVSNARDFYELTLAQVVDPATGKPDPGAMKRFLAVHPNSAAFSEWAQSAPWTGSWADQSYNSLNAFRFIDANGTSHLVRWSMEPTAVPTAVPHEALMSMGADFLEHDLVRRLAEGVLTWHLIVTFAQPGDPSNDATKAWPSDRRRVDVGTLVVRNAESEADGPCRDLNYDPTILPTGITVSDDPLLPARSAAYAKSFDLRTAEAADYPRKPGPVGERP
jgi:catalase